LCIDRFFCNYNNDFLGVCQFCRELFSEEELIQLLETSRQNNAKIGVTGMLLYKDGNFMQLIEGPEEAVRALHAKISIDPRHRGLMTLLQGHQEKRNDASPKKPRALRRPQPPLWPKPVAPARRPTLRVRHLLRANLPQSSQGNPAHASLVGEF
jgi:hypothetical protein